MGDLLVVLSRQRLGAACGFAVFKIKPCQLSARQKFQARIILF
jgi:hypothetical protein